MEYGWLTSVLLLLSLSLVPFLLPMGDAIPEPAKPLSNPKPARAHSRVVLIIVDGLAYRRATNKAYMPYLCDRRSTAAFGQGLASFPTITPTGLRGILGGHRMVSEPQSPTGMRTAAEADSILARASAAGLKAFVIGQFSWPPLFPAGHGAQLTVIPYYGLVIRHEHGPRDIVSQYDAQVLAAAQPVLRGERGSWDFLVLHFFEPDSIGHECGTAGGVYQIHLRWLDRQIETLSRTLAKGPPTTFLLLADHGAADDGTHGGLSSADREVPFMLWGAGIVPGKLGTFPLYDAAPTLAALLGVPPPAFTEGWPKLQAMRTGAKEKAAILRDLARQRQRRWAAVRESYPWAGGSPTVRITQLEKLYQSKKYVSAANVAESCIRDLDKGMEDALPEKWLWRLIAALWALVFAACFGLAWREASIRTVKVTASLSAACLSLLVFPLMHPSSWAMASGLVMVASVGIMIMTLIATIGTDSGLDAYGWALWWAAFVGLAFQEIVDVSLWSWLVLGGLFIGRALHLNRQNAATTALSLGAVLGCLILSSGSPAVDVSALRSLLPAFRWAAMAHVDWEVVSVFLLAGWLVGAYLPFVRFNDGPKPWTAYAWVVVPMIGAAALSHLIPLVSGWNWLLCAASLAALARMRPEPHLRGMWLSAVALAFYHSLSDDRQWCLLALAVAAGWALAWKTRDAHPMWEGLGLLGIGLWSFKLSGASLSFSHITVAEGYRAMGAGWHPYLLFAVLALKPVTAIGAPTLPRLAIRPFYSMLGIVPLLGALSAGNLSMMWWGRFMVGNAEKLTDTAEFAQAEFVLLLVWILLGFWVAIRAFDLVSRRVARPA